MGCPLSTRDAVDCWRILFGLGPEASELSELPKGSFENHDTDGLTNCYGWELEIMHHDLGLALPSPGGLNTCSTIHRFIRDFDLLTGRLHKVHRTCAASFGNWNATRQASGTLSAEGIEGGFTQHITFMQTKLCDMDSQL